MKIQLSEVSKYYYSECIIKQFNYRFSSDSIVGIAGANGSGKSTLLQLISSVLSPSEGEINYYLNGVEIPVEKVRHKIALISPAANLVKDCTVEQLIDFHFTFQNYSAQFTKETILQETWLTESRNKVIAELSSGMKQRLKIALAFFSDLHCILLDEPTTNLDRKGIHWLNSLIQSVAGNKLLIIASNEEKDFKHCDEVLSIEDFK